MKKLLFATGNHSKFYRFYKGLLNHDIELISLKNLNIDLEIEENGKDAIENAILKAQAYYEATKMTTMAMDDTLYLDNVPKKFQPGQFVRRVNGKRLTDEEMLDYYINLVKKYGKDGKLKAKWIYGIAIIKDGKVKTYSWSKEDFYLVDKKSDTIHIGYPLDSISISIKLNKYFTEITDEEKENTKDDESHVIEFISNNI